MRITVLNGVNLDVLGRRDRSLYGGVSLEELESRIYEWGRELEVTVQCRQTNHEGEYVKWCHDAAEAADGLIVNPGAWSHYSYAIRDALEHEPVRGMLLDQIFDDFERMPPDLQDEIRDDFIDRMIVVGYRQYYPVAPGMVLIKAPGHSADHQMAYIVLQSGREILHSVDAGWVLDNIRHVKGKAAPWVKEDVPAVNGQLRWLNAVLTDEPNVTVLVTHDDDLFTRSTTSGVIGGELML